jgi:predicted ABC-class ATPase
LEQSAVVVNSDGTVVTQLTINLPARGRTILGRAAQEIFGQTLTALLQKALNYTSLNATRVESHVNSIEDQVWLQSQLESHGVVAFVKDGAILPRASGVDDRPLNGGLPFESPENMRVSYQLPSTGVTISGMAFRKGISLICGGGFHGKSTLLEALQVGVYPKVPGDGREFVVTVPSAVKIRAEDGRCVTAVDISPFISNLPFGKDTTCFSTLDASGSTSQASNILEVSAFNHRRNRIFAVYDFHIYDSAKLTPKVIVVNGFWLCMLYSVMHSIPFHHPLHSHLD